MSLWAQHIPARNSCRAGGLCGSLGFVVSLVEVGSVSEKVF